MGLSLGRGVTLQCDAEQSAMLTPNLSHSPLSHSPLRVQQIVITHHVITHQHTGMVRHNRPAPEPGCGLLHNTIPLPSFANMDDLERRAESGLRRARIGAKQSEALIWANITGEINVCL